MLGRPSMRTQVEAALPGLVSVLARRTGLHPKTISRHLEALKAEGKAHVIGIQRTKGPIRAIWQAGPAEVQIEIPKLTQAQRSRSWRARQREKKDDPVIAFTIGAQRRQASKNADKMAKLGDPMVNLLFGKAK